MKEQENATFNTTNSECFNESISWCIGLGSSLSGIEIRTREKDFYDITSMNDEEGCTSTLTIRLITAIIGCPLYVPVSGNCIEYLNTTNITTTDGTTASFILLVRDQDCPDLTTTTTTTSTTTTTTIIASTTITTSPTTTVLTSLLPSPSYDNNVSPSPTILSSCTTTTTSISTFIPPTTTSLPPSKLERFTICHRGRGGRGGRGREGEGGGGEESCFVLLCVCVCVCMERGEN